MGGAGWIEQPVDDTLSLSVIADSGYEMAAVTQTEHLGSEASVYTTDLRWYEKEGISKVITQNWN